MRLVLVRKDDDMWKLFFNYSDGSKVNLTGKGRGITKEMLDKYMDQYKDAESAIYQKYPKKKYLTVVLWSKREVVKNE